MSHTPESWHVYEFSKVIYARDENGKSHSIARVQNGKISDALRIVACVNACRGIGTETLERFHGDHSPDNGFGLHRDSKLESERDTYRDLCGELLKAVQEFVDEWDGKLPEHKQENFVYRARCAITRAESVMGENSNG